MSLNFSLVDFSRSAWKECNVKLFDDFFCLNKTNYFLLTIYLSLESMTTCQRQRLGSRSRMPLAKNSLDLELVKEEEVLAVAFWVTLILKVLPHQIMIQQ